jgi:hypothetical protein
MVPLSSVRAPTRGVMKGSFYQMLVETPNHAHLRTGALLEGVTTVTPKNITPTCMPNSQRLRSARLSWKRTSGARI